jgi:hypothetical protein
VDDKRLTRGALEFSKPAHYFSGIRVRGQAADALDVGPDRHYLAMNPHLLLPVLQSSPAGSRSLIPDEDYRAGGIGQPLRQMVKDTAALSPSGRRDDYRRALLCIECFRSAATLHQAEIARSQRIPLQVHNALHIKIVVVTVL